MLPLGLQYMSHFLFLHTCCFPLALKAWCCTFCAAFAPAKRRESSLEVQFSVFLHSESHFSLFPVKSWSKTKMCSIHCSLKAYKIVLWRWFRNKMRFNIREGLTCPALLHFPPGSERYCCLVVVCYSVLLGVSQ